MAVQHLQTSINQHQHKVNSKYSVDAAKLLKYAHKLAYTSFAPLGHEAGQPLPPNARPPNPQDWQFRSSQLHQFQGVAPLSCLSLHFHNLVVGSDENLTAAVAPTQGSLT